MTAAASPAIEQQVWATCAHCRHTFVVFGPLPAPVETVATAMTNAECPACTTTPRKLFLAHDKDIQTALEGRAP